MIWKDFISKILLAMPKNNRKRKLDDIVENLKFTEDKKVKCSVMRCAVEGRRVYSGCELFKFLVFYCVLKLSECDLKLQELATVVLYLFLEVNF